MDTEGLADIMIVEARECLILKGVGMGKYEDESLDEIT
jgi:hypothetical protein